MKASTLYFQNMTEIIVFSLVLIAGIFLIVKRPLAQATGISIYWEVGVGAGAIITFLIFLSTAFITPSMIEEDLAKQPCGTNTPQGYCYNLKRDLCVVLWDKAHQECQLEMADALKSRPTGLIGPAINRCKARHMDKGIRFNRAQTETAYCKAYFEYIEDPNF
jgi:hypothetical protein